MTPTSDLEANKVYATNLLQRFDWIRNIRPARVGSLLLRLLAPDERRRIVPTALGLQCYVDPFSHLGRNIIESGHFEPETEEIFRKYVGPGDVFLDIGANEGFFSTLAGTLVGEKGFVIAIEPQSRLREIIEINLLINRVNRHRIFRNAIGGRDGDSGTINLWPAFNSGASSIVQQYRFSSEVDHFQFIAPERVLAESGVDHVDFVKIDVEGYEGEVINSLAPLMKEGKIRRVFVDYHRAILETRGIDPRKIEQDILSAGYRRTLGDTSNFESYFLYERT
jgi:FkbM family methyltransferase